MKIALQQTYLSNVIAKVVGGLRICFISDVHLGHPRTPTYQIITNLNKYVCNVTAMNDFDAIIVSGDLFDMLLTLPSMEVDLIDKWIYELLRLSVKTNTPIRVLEGTPSHDWKQSRRLMSINETYAIDADVQFIDTLSIVEDKTLGLTIGYVPDEWSESCDETTSQWKDLMATRGYDKVDLIVMHGMFEFQVPTAAAKAISHFKEYEWAPMARYGIVIGHDHRHKSKLNIVVPSSFERLAHNEEEHKGYLIMDIYHDTVAVTHVINEDAMKYKTVGDINMSDTEIISRVEKLLTEFGKMDEPLGRIKVKYNKKYDISHKLKEWRDAFTAVIVEAASETETIDRVTMDSEFTLKGEVINISPDNISGMILREINAEDDPMLDGLRSEIEHIQSLL